MILQFRFRLEEDEVANVCLEEDEQKHHNKQSNKVRQDTIINKSISKIEAFIFYRIHFADRNTTFAGIHREYST